MGLIAKIKQRREEKEKQSQYLIDEANRLKEENLKIVTSHNKLRKVVEGMIKNIKPEVNKATDEQIITSWNSGIPKESATTDIVVALRGSRKTMNAIELQGLNELINILDEGKKEAKSRLKK
jgi:hypothetical protein